MPVFILEIETGPKLGLVSVREEADIRIRKRLRDLISFCPLSKLHAVSAMGTKLRFYTAEAGGAITPLRIVSDDQFSIDTAPLECCDCDVLEVEGGARLKTVVYEIHAQLDSDIATSSQNLRLLPIPNLSPFTYSVLASLHI